MPCARPTSPTPPPCASTRTSRSSRACARRTSCCARRTRFLGSRRRPGVALVANPWRSSSNKATCPRGNRMWRETCRRCHRHRPPRWPVRRGPARARVRAERATCQSRRRAANTLAFRSARTASHLAAKCRRTSTCSMARSTRCALVTTRRCCRRTRTRTTALATRWRRYAALGGCWSWTTKGWPRKTFGWSGGSSWSRESSRGWAAMATAKAATRPPRLRA
mmetsp:Transcript_12600/g.39087  ORF Transcript_12600/g.39087 Transcript_12600/m.39087 type:complete len:222 (-) Transcript_12600:1212-1877(-)